MTQTAADLEACPGDDSQAGSRSAGRSLRLLLIAATAALLAATAGLAGPGSHARAAASTSQWVATWGTSPMAPTTLEPNAAVAGFNDQTVRNIIYTSVGGSQLRIRLSNTFGTIPLQVGLVSIGAVATGAQLVPGSRRAVTFGGSRSVTIKPGATVASDPVAFKASPLEKLAVSLYLPEATGPATYHLQALQTNYLAAGEHAGDTSSAAFTTTATSWYFLDGVDVLEASPAAGAVVAIGDSITDGVGSETSANARWTDDLARRLEARYGKKALAVVNAGIGGNRLLNGSACYGASALTRLNSDVLTQPGVQAVILSEGINDIGFSQQADAGCWMPNTAVTAAQIIGADKRIIAAAHARGLKVFGATITPFRGYKTWSAAAEAKRVAVNDWIRTGKAFDGVIDFAKAVRDPADSQYLSPAFDSGDKLHPNDAGYAAMAEAVNLTALP
jgi:lysophospholipase L1-like esterase